MERSHENKEKIRKWMIDLGYEFVTEKEYPRTNFVLEAKKREDDPEVSFQIISPKPLDRMAIISKSKLSGTDRQSFAALKEPILTCLEYNLKRNALLMNLDFSMNITPSYVEFNITDDMFDDGLTKDRIFDIIKRILGFYEFMNYVFRDHGIGRPIKGDKELV